MQAGSFSPRSPLTRRHFIGHTLAAGAAAGAFGLLPGRAGEAAAPVQEPREFSRKIRLGVIGNGGRGSWIANLFKNHGGYDMWAVADYFPEVADACGDAVGVDKGRRFSGLSGYKRLIDSGVEAVVLETPPCFFPEHARVAVEAGLHVYMAKPVAADVPGCLEIEAAAAKAKARRRVFMVDYQLPTEPANQKVVDLIRTGAVGSLAALHSHYLASQFPDPPLTDNLESRLRRLVWCNDVAVGGGYHVNACIHAVDAALWVAGSQPIAATGISRRMRPNPHGDSHDTFSILFEFETGLVLDHRGEHLNNQNAFDVVCQVVGQSGHAQICYGGKALLKGQEEVFNSDVPNPYEPGAVRNIAAFYSEVAGGKFENGTVRRAIDGALATILGREAALRKTRLTLAEVLKENRHLAVDLRGLKA